MSELRCNEHDMWFPKGSSVASPGGRETKECSGGTGA